MKSLLISAVLLIASACSAQSKSFVTWSTVVAASAAADVETTQYVINRPGHWYEINPILGPHPSRARMYSTIGAMDGAIMFEAWRLKGKGKRYWWMLPAGVVAVHVGGTVFSLKHF